MKSLRLLVWFTQLAFSAVGPLVLCIMGAVWLRERFQLGGWVILLGVLFGFGGAVSGFCNSLSAMKREGEAEDGDKRKEPPVSFNDHV